MRTAENLYERAVAIQTFGFLSHILKEIKAILFAWDTSSVLYMAYNERAKRKHFSSVSSHLKGARC